MNPQNDQELQTNATPSASGHKTVRRGVLEEAASLIDGDRNHTYGSPTENFSNIAELWTVRFRHLLAPGQQFTASDVADAQILVKSARGIANKTRDTYVDIAGYAGCGYECFENESKDPSTSVPSSTSVNITVTAPTDSADLRAEIIDGLKSEILKANNIRHK